MKKYYKVVTEDLKSLGLRKNPNIMTFPIGQWIHEPKKLIYSNKDSGGIWVAQTKSGAKGLARYMKNKYNISTKIFECEIGDILYQNSYRVKTDKVKITKLL